MGHVLLTSAAGLPGSYLMCDLLQSDTPVALLVSPYRRHEDGSAFLRKLTARWEQFTGRTLPQPVVLEGNLLEPGLGLSSKDRSWLASNCDRVIHDATVEFTGSPNSAESTAVVAAKNVAAVCSESGTAELHIVSAGSKCPNAILAEQALTTGAGACRSTIYRVGTAVGSKDGGFTPQFNDFYRLLRYLDSILSRTRPVEVERKDIGTEAEERESRLSSILNLTGNESKTMTSGDWISASVRHVLAKPELQGTTYNLSSRIDLGDVLKAAASELGTVASDSDASLENAGRMSRLASFYARQRSNFESELGDEPEPRSVQRLESLTELSAPVLDVGYMKQVCQFARASNFGWGDSIGASGDQSAGASGHSHAGEGAHDANGHKANWLGLEVSGSDPGMWEFQIREGSIQSVNKGLSSRCSATFYLNGTTYERIQSGQSSAEQAVRTGQVLIEGNGMPVDALSEALQSVIQTENPKASGESPSSS